MKKILCVLCCMLLILCALACNKKNTTMDNSGESNGVTLTDDGFTYYSDIHFAERYQTVSLSEAGILYDGNDGLIHLVTIDEGKDMPFCYDPNCTHPNAEATGGDPKCMAAQYATYCKTAYYNGTVYFFDGDGVFAHNVYTMDTNGSGRKLLAELPFFYHIGYLATFKEDKLYYVAKIPYKDDITNTSIYKDRVIELNLRDGSYRFITEETENMLSQADMAGDMLYMRRSSQENGRLYVEAVNIRTLETQVVITTDEWKNGNRFIDAYDEDSYYYWDKNTYEIGIKNIDGTVEEVLLRGAEGEGYDADASCDGIFYKREFDYGDETAGAYFLDMETRKITNITEVAEKYSIVGYDGYYDVFVARKDNKIEGKSYWSIWSKENVLGETGIS